MEIIKHLLNNTFFIGFLSFILIMVPILGIEIIHSDSNKD